MQGLHGVHVLGNHPDVVVVGSGIVGAACAEALTRRGVRVTVLDRSPLASGTTAGGEGNLLLSDKAPGPELALAQASAARWPRLLAELGQTQECEFEPKGGLVVAGAEAGEAGARALREFAAAQRAAGVVAHEIPPADLPGYEPHLTRAVAAAVLYPEDAQLQPVLAATALLAAVRARGGEVRTGVEALGVETGGVGSGGVETGGVGTGGVGTDGVGTDGGAGGARGRVTAVRTSDGAVPCGAVVNAGGPWAGSFAEAAGVPLPVLPRRGLVLVTAPLPPGTVRHKVYGADYVGAVGSDDAELRTSPVVESTRAGTVLIGSSRQRVGFDAAVRPAVLGELARGAVRLFPVLGSVAAIRAYGGFRPYTPDHLPVIGEDPRLRGVWHATGHEGSGIGLAAATGELLAQLYTGEPPVVDPKPFRVGRPGLGSEREAGTCSG